MATILAEKTWAAIQVGIPGPPPTMSGLILNLRFWDGKAWQTKPPTVEPGSIIGVRAIGRNTGDPLASMTINAVIYDPDAKLIAAATEVITWVGTGGEIEIVCTTVMAAGTEKEGIYTAYIELIGQEGGAYVLDTWENKIATIGKPLLEKPWLWIGIGGVALGGLILLAPKKK